MDEVDCPVIGFLAVMSISVGIVFVGLGLFFILTFFHILNFCSNTITVSRTVKNEIVDKITIGRLSTIFRLYF